jgi:hypothetical protein
MMGDERFAAALMAAPMPCSAAGPLITDGPPLAFAEPFVRVGHTPVITLPPASKSGNIVYPARTIGANAIRCPFFFLNPDWSFS